ncbi:mRNA-degrading endonuclease, toxin component of the MazEF toxin-antitoxin module [Hathewaya proteolytica DSM 3090]|uniref:mRNA-degrading endonuclease, toxin component of the MazEF toxin-antitoxin module n=1 Tax=Hathewaya proteolytica DSM 3090 TaxID=1121331 RepID=A0A1M6QB92_9CLOT|nr:type II toxin-antitoxin system PemK/MazF family toxin [Hathewaya proteolytica]SHK17363.1 mRNA-degrading endonuclease, toxin component of the MazEF toxin-antitoxin module [Hathewaya proteolytica DSM 3090]
MCNDIRSMSDEELIQYIEDTEKKIADLTNEYLNEFRAAVKNSSKCCSLVEQARKIHSLFKYIEWVKKKMEMSSKSADDKNINPRRGEIWTCELGQNVGSEENKIRPVIIIQNNTGNLKGPTTIVVPISNRQKKIKVHIQLRETDYNLVVGEAQKITGTVLCEQIKVVSKVRLGRKIATLKDDFIKILDSKLRNSLELQNK